MSCLPQNCLLQLLQVPKEKSHKLLGAKQKPRFGSGGFQEKINVICVLGLNVINDKVGGPIGLATTCLSDILQVFALTWFWCFLLAIFSGTRYQVLFPLPYLNSFVSAQIALANYYMLLFSLQTAGVQNPDQ